MPQQMDKEHLGDDPDVNALVRAVEQLIEAQVVAVVVRTMSGTVGIITNEKSTTELREFMKRIDWDQAMSNMP